MVKMVTHCTLMYRLKRVRPLLVILTALAILFYYSFLNEEHDLNQYQDETALPRITKDKSKQDGTGAALSGGSSSDADNLELSTLHGMKEKNRFFPLLESETEKAKLPDFTLPDVYFADQFSLNLRPQKKKFRYSVGQENHHRIPKVKKPRHYPIIQSSTFTDGGKKDEAKLNRIKKAFEDSLQTYKEHGYGHDEVLPISHRPNDPFNGWAATLVDALDTMLLMGFKADFDEAVKYISKINFKQSFRDDIPLFENTIRILAGLISGYELSKENILLKSAKDFAELLMEAFDTPNNMPLLYYKWRDEIQNRFASKRACLAEVGTLSLEFTRLTQLTGDNKYYDAITRITKMLEKSADNFYLPGLYSNRVDISGCKVIKEEELESAQSSNTMKVIRDEKFQHCTKHDKIKSATKKHVYSLGGLGDSFYEYMPKMYHLLRGHDDAKIYKDMYLRMMGSVRRYMLFNPKIPNGDKMLFVSNLEVEKQNDEILVKQQLDMAHLTCFAGGMFAFGARLFNISSDIGLAEKVTFGCVHLYEKLKIMPESVVVDKMVNKDDHYDEQHRIALIENSSIIKPAGAAAVEEVNQLSEEEKWEARLKAEKEAEIEADVSYSAKKRKRATEETSETQGNVKIKIKYENAAQLPPFKDMSGTTKVWSVDKTFNQPIWANKMAPKYILRPEAIESVYYMYRITGDSKWRDYGWMMWENIEKYCKDENGQYAALSDVTNLGGKNNFIDSLESFWFAETLKYFYLLFDDASNMSLDDYVFNTEAHSFKLTHSEK